MTFSVGDRVFINGNYPDPVVVGLTGTVTEIKRDGQFPVVVSGIILPDNAEPCSFYFDTLELTLMQQEIAYDPEQQGDLEDDI